MSFEQFISSVPLQEKKKRGKNQYMFTAPSMNRWYQENITYPSTTSTFNINEWAWLAT